MKTPTRVRFAPSPTGFLNLGGARSALFNWLFACQQQGVFILRLEDTDRERFVPESVQQLQAGLEWLGLGWDEGVSVDGQHAPYVQSERLGKYRAAADQLVQAGTLYPCWCSTERLDDLRRQAQLEKRAFKYDRHCLTVPGDLEQPHVLRFRVPDEPKAVEWNDLVKGPLSVETADLDDFVAMKSDGFPTYHLANVVDDHAMDISHVLRADEWLPSTPKHLLLYAAFGWQSPLYAHLPAVLGPGGGKKLSKRDGAREILEYRDAGYLPEAIINFLALLGWNPGDGSTQEVYSREELVATFSLERIQKSPAVFDEGRLEWLNGLYIRNLPLTELASRATEFWPEAGASAEKGYLEQVLGLVQDRLKTLGELAELTDFFFTDPDFDPSLIKEAARRADWLQAVIAALPNEWEHEALELALRKLAGTLDAPVGQLFMLLRVALTGRTASPGLFETMAVLGAATTKRRLVAAAKQLSV